MPLASPRATRLDDAHPAIRYRSIGLPAGLFAASLVAALTALALWSRTLIAVEAATPPQSVEVAIAERRIAVPRTWIVAVPRGASPERLALHAPLGAFLGRDDIHPDLAIGLSIARADDALPPSDRPVMLYGRFLVSGARTTADGLVERSFAPGTPYEGETLHLAPPQGRSFSARCLEPKGGAQVMLPCLAEIRRAGLDAQVRLPREALGHWTRIVAEVDTLLTQGTR